MKSSRYVIVGASAAGASCAAKLRRLDENAEIILLEKGSYLSYSACSLPYLLSGVVHKASDLVLMSPMSFKKRFNIDARINSPVTAIDRKKKTVTVTPANGNPYKEPYDILVLATGSVPRVPEALQGAPNTVTLRSVDEAKIVRKAVEETHPSSIMIVGAGLAAIEIAENLADSGARISICQHSGQILSSFDDDMSRLLLKELLDHGIEVYLNETVTKRTASNVTLSSGKTVPADLVIAATGTLPDTRLAKEAGLAIGESGGVAVSADGKTSDPAIYAAGDMAEITVMPEKKPAVSAQAGPAQQEGRNAALAIKGKNPQTLHAYHSLVLPVFSLQAAQCGLSEKRAKENHYNVETATVIPPDRVSLMPGVSPVFLKVVFEKPSGKILGAEAVGKGDVLRRIAVIDAVMQKDGTLEDLASLDLPYAPTFSNAKDAVNIAGMVGLHILRGDYRQVSVADVPDLVNKGAYIIDVREPMEWKAGHIKGAHSIPLSEFRNHLSEIPKDRPVYLHCRSGQRSYYALCILQNLGWKNVYNISGSYLFLAYYDYISHKVKGKESILTGYPF